MFEIEQIAVDIKTKKMKWKYLIDVTNCWKLFSHNLFIFKLNLYWHTKIYYMCNACSLKNNNIEFRILNHIYYFQFHIFLSFLEISVRLWSSNRKKHICKFPHLIREISYPIHLCTYVYMFIWWFFHLVPMFSVS